MGTISEPKISRSFDYASYVALISECVQNRSTTGSEQTPERIQASILNEHRMKRIFKHAEIREELKNELKKINREWDWLVLAESWCGDGAQNIPLLAKMASLSDKINLRIILRDENPGLMDEHLTSGKRAIPKLICIDHETQEVLGTWGPRPTAIAKMVLDFKKENPDISHDALVKNIQLWYAKDAGKSLQDEFTELIRKWTSEK